MTRPFAFRSVAWRGEDGDESYPFSAVPPKDFDGYLVTGRLRVTSHPPDLEQVTITDKNTGAQVTVQGESVTLTAAGDSTPEYRERLWRDALHLAAVARRLGRPPRTGAIQDDEQILRVIRQMRSDPRGPKVTAATVAARSAAFSPENLRYYLRSTGRKWRDLSRTS